MLTARMDNNVTAIDTVQASMEAMPRVVPRIRDITGIRIHQLTLPESLSFADKLQPDDQEEEDDAQTPLAGPSSPSLIRATSHTAIPSRRERSASTIPTRPTRERSSSSSVVPPSPASRVPRRARAPTLAGEAMVLQKSPIIVTEEPEQVQCRRLARCFVVLKIPRPPLGSPHDELRRQRTTSMDNTLLNHPRAPAKAAGARTETDNQQKINDAPMLRTSSDKARQRRSYRPTISTRNSSNSPFFSSPQSPNIPFYISPIHHKSTFPRFLDLSSDDFASWLTTEEGAGTYVELEVWYEDGGWKMLDICSAPAIAGARTDSSRGFNFTRLKRAEKGKNLPENTVLFSFASNPQAFYFVSTEDPREDVKLAGVVEKSMRETRMRRGIGIGALHQLVNMQSVLVDTKRGVEEVQKNIDRMLLEDIDRRAIRRCLRQRQEQCHWLAQKIEEVGKVTREVSAHVTLREQALEHRRSHLDQGYEQLGLLHAQASDLAEQVDRVDSERIDLLKTIHHYRTHHVQTLDSLFPISPLHPPSLLYSILNVPLPIPSGPKDPAPPLSVPSSSLPDGVAKMDERTTAAALGYVAMVVQILGNLGGAVGGVPYPVTCAGSRSLVKDVVSVIQGPRSFPLYSKGVERYRYEYAVFLLNKNIETLMQESNIRILDIRHTLPNLKILLLTLSSPVQSSSITTYPGLSRTSTFIDSRSSSRVTSATFPQPYHFSSHKLHSGKSSVHEDENGAAEILHSSPTRVRSSLRNSLLLHRNDLEDDEKSLDSEDAATVSEMHTEE